MDAFMKKYLRKFQTMFIRDVKEEYKYKVTYNFSR